MSFIIWQEFLWKGGGTLRYKRSTVRRRWPLRLWARLAAAAGIAAFVCFNAYVEREIQPTMMQIAEYEARRLTTQAVHQAVEERLGQEPQLCEGLYKFGEGYVELDATVANQVRSTLLSAVETQMAVLPEQEYSIPFGSLTGNYLLSGQGPGWKLKLQPEGYVQASWQESYESLSINTTRYTAELSLSVTVNMILDGRSETLTVREALPMLTLLLQGESPRAYASVLD